MAFRRVQWVFRCISEALASTAERTLRHQPWSRAKLEGLALTGPTRASYTSRQAEGAQPRREVSQAQRQEGSLRDVPSHPVRDRRKRDTVEHDNKDDDSADSPLRRIANEISRWMKRNGRTVQDQMIRGAAYSLGSGAVSVVLIWFQVRH